MTTDQATEDGVTNENVTQNHVTHKHVTHKHVKHKQLTDKKSCETKLTFGNNSKCKRVVLIIIKICVLVVYLIASIEDQN